MLGSFCNLGAAIDLWMKLEKEDEEESGSGSGRVAEKLRRNRGFNPRGRSYHTTSSKGEGDN